MLKQLRQKRVMKKVLWALAIIIIPAFVLWGAAGIRERANYAGIIFGKKITFDEYRASFNAVKNKGLLTYGSQFYQLQEMLNLEEAAWERLIMLREAKSKRIRVSDEELIARIASFGFFQNKDGTFNRDSYEKILNNAFRTSPRTFEEEIRQSIMLERLIEDVMKDAIEPTDEEIEEAIKKEVEENDQRESRAKAREEDVKQKEESPKEMRERIKNKLATSKRLEIYQKWRDELYQRAGLVDNIKKEKPEIKVGVGEEEVEKETTNDKAQNSK